MAFHSDISLDFDGIVVEQLYPNTLPDLFAGNQLVLTGRYRDGGPATITLNGTVNGESQEFVYEDNLFRNRGGDDLIFLCVCAPRFLQESYTPLE